MKKTKLTHLEMSRELKCSKSNVQRLAGLGMPLSSAQDARDWIAQRAKDNPQAATMASLADQRREKLRLECALLSLRLQREQDGAEFLPAAAVTDCVRVFSRLAMIAMRYRAEEQAEALAATTTPNQAVKITRTLLLESWLTGICGMLGQLQLDGRLVASIKTLVREEFAGIDDDQVEEWMRAVNGGVAAPAN